MEPNHPHSPLHLHPLKADDRIAQAKKLLLEAIQDHQKSITKVLPPNKSLASEYKSTLETFAKSRGAPLWYPYIGTGIGNGPFVELLDGSVKYDFIGGIGVHHFGHSHPALIESSIDAALSDVIMQGNLQQNTDSMELINLLVEKSGLDHCFLSTSGSMANDNALKIAFQKNHPADRVLAFERGFCGRTWAMAQITEKPQLREGIPVRLGVDYLPFYDPNDPEGSTQRAVKTLKQYLYRYPKQYAMMIFEMIQGEGGYNTGTREFFRPIMEILKENHVAIHVDEVQTFGRTSCLFAFQHFGLEDLVDIVTLGKLAQVCATLYTKEYNPRSGLLSQTFTSSTQAIQASKIIINLMINEGFFGPDGKNMRIHRQFVENFESIHKKHPHLIRGPYGLGGMVAFTPLAGEMQRSIQFGHELFHNGVMSFICGKDPTKIRFLVPIGAVTPKDVDAVCKILEETLLTCSS